MIKLFTFAVMFAALQEISLAGELTFELPDNERMCFYENVPKGEQATLEFQVSFFLVPCSFEFVV